MAVTLFDSHTILDYLPSEVPPPPPPPPASKASRCLFYHLFQKKEKVRGYIQGNLKEVWRGGGRGKLRKLELRKGIFDPTYK